MFHSLALTACLAITVLASLKDLAHCDPLKKDARCPPDPAFGGRTSFDFTKASWNDDLKAFWSVDAGTAKDDRHIGFDNPDGKGADFNIWQDGQAPTLTSNRYLLFGKVSVEVQAAQGPGLITAIVLKSDSGDEIDWELLGAFENQAQTNYFFDGQPLFNTYNTTYSLTTSSFSQSHKYAIEWTPASLAFSIDNTVRKTWRIGDIPSQKWPQTPMQVKIGIWSVSNDSDPGEIAWAGSVPDWQGRDDDKNPYKAYFKTLEIEDFVGGCNATDQGVGDLEYEFNDRTHGWQDIQIKGCKARTVPGENTPPAVSNGGGVSHPTQSNGDDASSATTTADGTNETEQASQTDGQTPSQTSESGDDQGAAPLGRQLSSPLAAIVLVGWLLVF